MRLAQACRKHPDREALSFCVKCGCPLCPECERPFDGRPYCAECLKKRKSGDRGEKVSRAAAQVVGAAATAAAKPKQKLLEALISAGRNAGGAELLPGVSVIPKEVRRVFARLIDFIAVGAFSIPVSWMFRIVTHQWMSDVGGLGFDLSIYAAVLLIGTSYFIVTERMYGKTIGKWMLNLKAVSYGDGSRLTLGAVCWRWIGFLAAMIWTYIGYRVGVIIMGLMGIFKQGMPLILTISGELAALAITAIFSLGLLMTFVGKYKRGFHDLLGRSIVVDETITGRGKQSGSKN
jgi:uncharacterized RDD family membrane protein YckC